MSMSERRQGQICGIRKRYSQKTGLGTETVFPDAPGWGREAGK